MIQGLSENRAPPISISYHHVPHEIKKKVHGLIPGGSIPSPQNKNTPPQQKETWFGLVGVLHMFVWFTPINGPE